VAFEWLQVGVGRLAK